MDAKQLLDAACKLGLAKTAAGTGMGQYNPYTRGDSFGRNSTPAPRKITGPDKAYDNQTYNPSWQQLNQESGFNSYWDPNKQDRSTIGAVGKGLWGLGNAGVGTLAGLGGALVEGTGDLVGSPGTEAFGRDMKWGGNARMIRGAHQFVNPGKSDAMANLGSEQYKEQLAKGNVETAKKMQTADRVGTSATDAIPWVMGGKAVARGGGLPVVGKPLAAGGGMAQMMAIDPALTYFNERGRTDLDPTKGIPQGMMVGPEGIDYVNQRGEMFGPQDAERIGLLDYYDQLYADATQPDTINADGQQPAAGTLNASSPAPASGPPVQQQLADLITSQQTDPNGGMDPSLQQQPPQQQQSKQPPQLPADNPLAKIMAESNGPYSAGPGQPQYDPAASMQQQTNPNATAGTDPGATQPPAPAAQPPASGASALQSQAPQETASATGAPADPGWAAAQGVMTAQEADAQIAQIQQQVSGGQQPDPQQVQQLYRSKAIHHLQEQMPGATPEQLDQELGSLMARGEQGDWTPEDLTTAMQNFAADPAVGGDAPANPQDQGFLQQFLDYFTGLDTWQQLAMVIGIPVAIGGIANAAFGGGGMGSLGLAGLGLGAAAMGAFDPMGWSSKGQQGSGSETTGATQPNAGGQNASNWWQSIVGEPWGKAQAAADMQPDNPLYADTTRSAYDQMQQGPGSVLSYVPGTPMHKIRQNYQALGTQ